MLLAADCLSDLQEHALAAQAYREVLEAHAGRRDGAAASGRRPLLVRAARGRGEGAPGRCSGRRPDTPQAHYFLGAVLFEQKRTDEARTHLERELALDPRCAGCLAKLAHVAYLAGDDRQCESLARAGGGARPGATSRRTWSPGCSRTEAAATTRRSEHLSRVVEQAPGYAKAQYQLALAYQRSGNAAKAREHHGDLQPADPGAEGPDDRGARVGGVDRRARLEEAAYRVRTDSSGRPPAPAA